MKRENHDQNKNIQKKQKKEKEKEIWTLSNNLEFDKQKNISFFSKNEIQIQNLSNKKIDIIPILDFSQLNLPKKIKKNISYQIPTPIQSCTWSLLFNQNDVVGIAKTGSGKTMAFGLPLILHIHNLKLNLSKNNIKPIALVLAPTRVLIFN